MHVLYYGGEEGRRDILSYGETSRSWLPRRARADRLPQSPPHRRGPYDFLPGPRGLHGRLDREPLTPGPMSTHEPVTVLWPRSSSQCQY